MDGELSALAAVLDQDHADRCEDCRAFADKLEAITARIRATPPQPFLGTIEVPHDHRLARHNTLRAFAALGLLLALATALGSSAGPPPARAPQAAYLQSIDYERQLLRVLARPGGMPGWAKAV
jgi:hypothetical protein